MGVMSCRRKDCESIMCDLYVDGVGYVCADCQSEFKEYLKSQNIVDEVSDGEMKRYLEKFMDTRKHDYTQGPKVNVDSFFAMYRKRD